MNKVKALVLAMAVFTFSCNSSSNKEVKEADKNLSEAKTELNEAETSEHKAAVEKETAEWKAFRNETDSSITKMEKDLDLIKAKAERAGSKDRKKLKSDYAGSKEKLVAMKEKLRQKNIDFEKDMKTFSEKVSVKNESFKREFKHDMNEFGKSFKDLFKDNVK
jgi:hypothetical protein